MSSPPAPSRPVHGKRAHYRELLRRTLLRQTLLYFLPLLLLAAFFNVQYWHFTAKNRHAHLEVLAEQQASTLDLFLHERLVNLGSVIDDQAFIARCCSGELLGEALGRLRQSSAAFVDVGIVDGRGELVVYNGPVRFPGPVSYGTERWFQQLMAGESPSIITDIYLGFRGQPHFTLAVKRRRGEATRVLRAALSPEKITEFLHTLEGAREVQAAVINARGTYQVVTRSGGAPHTASPYLPPRKPHHGYLERPDARGSRDYAYAWLGGTPWALVVKDPGGGGRGAFAGLPSNVQLMTLGFFLLMGLVILLRARQLVGKQLAVEQHEAELSGQLVQAAKLASVGELAAGIAHEINNPLAIIAEEVGLLRDMMDPELAADQEPLDIREHLDAMHEAVFRCRDITRKLLSFVRQTDVKVQADHVHRILDHVLDGILGNEIKISNVELVRDYDDGVLEMTTDRNQLIQVMVNLVKNAIDAMGGEGGRLTVRTMHRGDGVAVAVADTGCGLSAEQREKVFMPFFTTKPPGEGTGLGLSVSLSIIKNFGGSMYVESAVGQGSTFTIELPYELK